MLSRLLRLGWLVVVVAVGSEVAGFAWLVAVREGVRYGMEEGGLSVRWDGGDRRCVYDGMEGCGGSIGGTGDGWTMGRMGDGMFLF